MVGYAEEEEAPSTAGGRSHDDEDRARSCRPRGGRAQVALVRRVVPRKTRGHSRQRPARGIGSARDAHRSADDRLCDGVPCGREGTVRDCHYCPLLRRAGLTRLTFHALRHTAATLMLGSGTHIRVVAERLGHADPAVTLRVYSHVTPTMQREAAQVMDAVLSGRA
jgi:integrase